MTTTLPMPRIVQLTTVHPRDDIRIFHKECVSLARAGYEVVQVVGAAGRSAGGIGAASRLGRRRETTTSVASMMLMISRGTRPTTRTMPGWAASRSMEPDSKRAWPVSMRASPRPYC